MFLLGIHHNEATAPCLARGKYSFNMKLCCLIVLVAIACSVKAFVPQPNHATRRNTHLFAANSNTPEQLLQKYGFGLRLQTVTPSDLPIVAEMHDNGAWELCRITKLEPPSKVGSPPRIQIQSVGNNADGKTRMVDFGQITTIWESGIVPNKTIIQDQLDSFQKCEEVMQQLYQSYSYRAQKSKLTKKQISKIVKGDDGPDRAHTEDVMRKVLKAGNGMARLVDSYVAMDYLYSDDYPKTEEDAALRRAVGGYTLAQDASLGGRYKRMACTYVSSELERGDEIVSSLSFVNGGWLVVDESVRAGAEARKFAERTQDTNRILTVADERIAQRLECLAMGEVFGSVDGEKELEVDVRETLKALSLPMTPKGAREALVRIGRWSGDAGKMEPWSSETLNAAKTYAQADLERRKQFVKAGDDIEGRVDLTNIPSVCVDAKSTAFRDDAIGVRPRSSTGRKLIPEASEWEVLIHIADVSDIYVPKSRDFVNAETIEQLRNSAINRGMSRYDLPLGPLHLLPPTLLKALGFIANKPNDSSTLNVPNRCVTLWAYIDERNGKVLDVGVERTLISSPLALTYASASDCLDNRDKLDKNHPLQKASAVLGLAERNLLLWSNQYKQSNVAAQKRDKRLAAKAIVAQNRQDGFQRSRGHRLVDMALDLYGVSLTQLLRREKAPIPRASGSGSDRMGRVATAPLRRMVDGMAQRQALAVLCGYGGKPLTVDECREINAQSNEAMDRLTNLRPLKRGGGISNRDQQRALAQLETRAGDRVIKAVSTGRGNEVSIDGAVGKCQGLLSRKLKLGQRVSVIVQTLNVEKGILTVELAE